MSFSELAKASVARRKKDVTITMPDGGELVFHANEISYLDRVSLGVSSLKDGDINTRLIVMSITDADGNHMTMDQALKLSDEHQEVFYRAALDVNKLEDGKESKKKVKLNAA